MRTLSAFAVSSALAFLSACGGGDAGNPVQAPTEPAESPTLDFSAIAGAWAGWGLEANGTQFWILVNMNSSAETGSVAGLVEYGLGDNPGDENSAGYCKGNWHANNADHPVYVVAERITLGGCPDGRVVLELDPEAGTLSYDYTPDNAAGSLEAEGTLIRGTDPGPKP